MLEFKKNGRTYGEAKEVILFISLVMLRLTRCNKEFNNLKKMKKIHGFIIGK
jgi:hypothetical protein